MNATPPANARPLSLLSVIIPAQNEAGCIASTVEHLDVELRLRNVPHEIIVVDDASSDKTWEILTELHNVMDEVAPDEAKTACHDKLVQHIISTCFF